MQEEYDKAQICLNGHVMNGHVEEEPHDNKIYCSKCGEKTIMECTSCHNPLQGLPYNTGGRCTSQAYCHHCGKPYPWTERKIQAAIQLFTEFGDLAENEKKTIEEDINNIARDNPEAEISARRIKQIWGKCGHIAYDILMEFSSRTAAKILKN